MRPVFLIVGILALLVGVVWVLQGAGVLMGSFMSGSSLWLGIGAVLVVVGLVVAALGVRAPGPKKAV